ncbi:MAG: hypothetical protein M1818_001974 [Claussenomyces sp. TS43310]|nr:MAG: hypothetical protein M1818_001974 [Claussenomyces sp. TS43310]
MYRPTSVWTWTFLIISILQAVAVIAVESYVFAKFQDSLAPNLNVISLVKTIPTYLTLFSFGFVYEVFLVYDSLRLKNTIQVIGLCIFNIAMLVYAAVQIDQIHKAILGLATNRPVYINDPGALWKHLQPCLIAVPCVIAFASLIMAFTAWKLYEEFAWTIYKHISADLRMKQRFLTFQIWIALLKFDFFFFLGFTVQFLVIVTKITDAEFYCTIVAIPVTILILLLAGFWTRRENIVGMILIVVLCFGGLAYFIFKLVRIYQPGHIEQYLPVQKSLTVFAVLTIVLILLTIVNACVCMSNFGKGLKPFVMRRKIRSEDEKSDNATELPDLEHRPLPNRMTIE